MRSKISLLIVALIALNSCTRQQTPITKEEVIAVIEKFDHGWEYKNMKAVDSTLATSYTYFTQSGGVFSRDSVVATAGEPDYALHDMSRTEFDITLFENTAIVSTRWKGKGNYRGVPFDEDQRCSIVVMKKGNRVQIISEHCTPIKMVKIFH